LNGNIIVSLSPSHRYDCRCVRGVLALSPGRVVGSFLSFPLVVRKNKAMGSVRLISGLYAHSG